MDDRGNSNRREQRILKALLGNPRACIAVLKGRELRYEFVNETYQLLRPEFRMVGRTYREVFPEAAAAGAEVEFYKVIDTGRPVTAHGHNAPIPGKPDATWDHRIVLLSADSGEEPLLLVTTWDVTDHRRTEDALRKSEERLRNREETLKLAVEATGLGIFDYHPLTGELVWSDIAKSHFGLPPDAFVDYDVFLSGLHPDDRERVDGIVRDVLHPESGGGYRTEYRTIGIRDRRKRWLSAQGQVIFSPEGAPVRFIGATVDITDRKLKEEQLQKALSEAEEERRILDAMMAHIPMGITIADAPDVNIRVVSRFGRDLTGKPPEQIEGIPVGMHTERWDIFRADGVTPARNEELPLTRATREGEIVREEIWVLGRADGTRIPILCTAAPIRDQSGRITGGVIGWQDISERLKAEDELRRTLKIAEDRAAELESANREMEAFGYSLAHDLRTPLRSIRAFSEMLMETYADNLDKRGKMFLDRIAGESRRMTAIVYDVMKMAVIARSEMRSEPIDMSGAVMEIARNLAESEPERKVDFIIQPGVQAWGDPSLVRILLENLLDNAWKFTGKRERARIEFGFREENGERIYFVRDNGVGFDMAYADRIFTPFQRLHKLSDFSGSGIGLATVQRIVHRHGGRIWAESKFGEGAVFCFSLSLSYDRQ